MKKLWIPEESFGVLLPLIQNEQITDLNWSQGLWVDHLYKGRYRCHDVMLSKLFLEQFSARLSNLMNVQFNKNHPLLEAETDELRISILHESVTNTGLSLSIRKTPARRRLQRDRMLLEQYCTGEAEAFLANCVRAHMTCMIGGLVGTGKTELLKYMTKEIPDYERVWTIEDTLEIRYSQINPGKDCVEVKVQDVFDYRMALKASKRQMPKWVLVAEVRSTEVVYLFENISAGIHCISTLHLDDISRLPDRLKNMGVHVEECDIYSFINIGILLESAITERGIVRKIAQIMAFSRVEEQNRKVMLYEDGRVLERKLPPDLERKFIKAGISDPWKRNMG